MQTKIGCKGWDPSNAGNWKKWKYIIRSPFIPDKCIPTRNQNTCPGAIPSSSIARPTQGAGGAHHQGMHAARAGLVLFRGFPPDFSMGSSWKIQNYSWNMDLKKLDEFDITWQWTTFWKSIIDSMGKMVGKHVSKGEHLEIKSNCELSMARLNYIITRWYTKQPSS